MLSVFLRVSCILSVVIKLFYAEYHYAECRQAMAPMKGVLRRLAFALLANML
jgi:hypothetical protein